MKKPVFIIILLLLSVVLVHAQERIIESSSRKTPKWMKRPPRETKEFVFSVGIKTGGNSIEKGEAQARLNALGKLFETYFGIKGKSTYQKVRRTLETEYVESMKVTTKGELWGIKLSDWYWKKYEVVIPAGIEYRYDVWVLMEGKKADIRIAVAKIATRIKKTEKTVKSKLIAAKMDLRSNRVRESLQKIQTAEQLVKTLDDESFVEQIIIQSEAISAEISRDLKVVSFAGNRLKFNIPISIKVTYNKIPQEGIPVEFRFTSNSGTIKSPVYSDEDGIASTSIIKIDFPLKTSTVEAKIGYRKGNAIKLYIEPVATDVGVLITLYEEANGERLTPGILQANLISTFAESGFMVKEVELERDEIQMLIVANLSTIRIFSQNYDVDYIITGNVKTIPAPKTGEFIFTNVSGVLKVINSKTGKIIVSEFIDEKGAGLSESQATENAFKNAAEKSSNALKEKVLEYLSF